MRKPAESLHRYTVEIVLRSCLISRARDIVSHPTLRNKRMAPPWISGFGEPAAGPSSWDLRARAPARAPVNTRTEKFPHYSGKLLYIEILVNLVRAAGDLPASPPPPPRRGGSSEEAGGGWGEKEGIRGRKWSAPKYANDQISRATSLLSY